MKDNSDGKKPPKRRGYAHYSCTEFLLDDDYCLFVEDYFHEQISLERKRAERSGRPFLLMLVEMEGLAAEAGLGCAMKRVAGFLYRSTREVDIKGWYRDNHTAGVIFTEISAASAGAVKEKVLAGLSDPKVLGSGLIGKVRVSFHLFPEENGGKASKAPFDLKLYPDLAKKKDRMKARLLLKRAVDIAGSTAGLILFSPAFLIIAALVKMTSPGPVFFRQKRVGYFGEPFVFLKFRSMYIGNDEKIHSEYVKALIREQKAHGVSEGGAVYKISNDPRVTRLGRIIRKTSLDELPQFLNVLSGRMSLVGPRPAIPYELEVYRPWHMERIKGAKPGITGLWQVKGRSKTTFDDMVRMDIRYIRGQTLWLDIKMIIETPWSMLTSKGAY